VAITKKLLDELKHYGNRLPEGLPAMETALGKVYCHPKRVF